MRRFAALLVVLLVVMVALVGCGSTAATTTTAAGAATTTTTSAATTVSSETTTTTMATTTTSMATTTTIAPTTTTMAVTTTTEAPPTTVSDFYKKYSGTGSKIINLGQEPSSTIFLLHLTAKADFNAKCFDSSGQEVATEPSFSNPNGAYDGRVGATAEMTKFQINTKGAWTLEVLPISAIHVLNTPGTITGKSDDVVQLQGNPSSLKISGNPKDQFGNFIVDYYPQGGGSSTNLVNELGKYDGVAVVSGNGALSIEADYPWTITAEQ